jgi:protein-export membrane protein SecD
MKPHRYKLYLVLSLLIAFGGLAVVLVTGTRPALGLDLEGGVSVTLLATGEGAADPEALDKTVDVIRQRIDALGVAEAEVSRGDREIFIQLPGVENEERALELIGSTAQLTFREVVEEFPREGEPEASPSPEESPSPDASPEPDEGDEVTEATDASVDDQEVVYPDANDSNRLFRLAPAALTGDAVERAEAVVDTQLGSQWSVSIRMTDEGADSWEKLTSEQACQRDQGEDDRIAIVLDGEVVSSPGMQEPGGSTGGVECGQGISGGDSQIDTGGETEAKDLALVLRYGALPITLEQQEIQKISPTLGSDSLQAGLRAGIFGLALVMIYMVAYYRALGFVVWLGLAVFTAALYVLLALLGASAGLSLSLAGIAGVIVSVGVTADSYIVAFERLKDEMRSGKSLRAAVDRGMQRAFKTILVADFVTGSAAIILFLLASGSVRGFALTLGLATLIDVFVAYFFTRSAVNLLARSPRFSDRRFIGLRQALGADT